MRRADPERKKKHRKRFRVIMEIAFMVLGIMCGTMPYPFPLLVPIGIGMIRIIGNAVKKEKEPEAPPPIVYCNGEKEPKRRKASNVEPVLLPPEKGKTAVHTKKESKSKNEKGER